MDFIKKNYPKIFSFFLMGLSIFFLYNSCKEVTFFPLSEILYLTIEKILPFSSVLFAIVFFFRKSWRQRTGELFFFCFTITFFLVVTYHSKEVEEQIYYGKVCNKELASLVEKANNSSLLSDHTEYPVENYGEFGVMLSMVKKSIQFSENMFLNISKANATLEQIFLPENLLEQKEILNSKEQLTLYLKKINSYEQQCYENFTLFENQIKETFFGSLREQSLNTFTKTRNESIELLSEYFSSLRGLANVNDEILDFFNAIHGNWVFEDNSFVFKNDDDYEKLTALVDVLNSFSKREEIALEKLRMQEQANFEKIGKIL